jgi:hypothetical protein
VQGAHRARVSVVLGDPGPEGPLHQGRLLAVVTWGGVQVDLHRSPWMPSPLRETVTSMMIFRTQSPAQAQWQPLHSVAHTCRLGDP